MSLPEQIQKQVDDAKSIVEQHYGTGETGAAPGEPSGNQNPETNAAPPTVREPAGEQAPASPAEDENSLTYAQRWRSLQGVYNSQHAQLQTAMQRVASLEGVIAMMNAQPAAQSEARASGTSFITDKDREEYGDELIDFTTRAIKQENAVLASELEQTRAQLRTLGDQFQQLRGQIVPTVQQVAQTQQQSAQASFFGRLTASMPNWEAVNADPTFHRWLLTPDPMTGINRQTYLEAAQRELDAGKVLSIFHAFAPVTGAPSASTRKAPGDELALQVAPGRTLSAPAPSANDARKWSRADIAKLYDDNRRGVYRGRESDFKALERDLFAAQKEGRVA